MAVLSQASSPRRAARWSQRLLASKATEVLRQRRKVRKTADVKPIHDMRVATRRLQETLTFLDPYLAKRTRQRLYRRARRMRRCLGEIRNADVMVDLVRKLRDRLPPAERRRVAGLLGGLRAEASALRRSAAGRTGFPVPGARRRIQAALDHLADANPRSLVARGRAVLSQRMKDLNRLLPAARQGEAASLHALRIAVKRYRYALEILAEVGCRDASVAIRPARELQEALGRVHDLDVLIDLVRTARPFSTEKTLLPRLRRERRQGLRTALNALDGFRPARVVRSPSRLGGEAA